MTINDSAVLRRRKFLEALPLLALALAGCEAGVKVDLNAKSIVDGIVDGIARFAPPDLAGNLIAARKQLEAGGDWKKTTAAFIPLTQSIIDLGVVPEPYASLTRTALGGLGLLLGYAGAPGTPVVTMPQALEAAKQLRDLR